MYQAVNRTKLKTNRGLFIDLLTSTDIDGPPGVLGIWVEWLFIFRELGSTCNYFRGARKQAHNFGDLGSLVKKPKRKSPILFDLKKNLLLLVGGGGASPPDPTCKFEMHLFSY